MVNLTQMKTATNTRNWTRTILGPEARLKIPETIIPATLLLAPTITDMSKNWLN
jgi:hypothetical protein